MAADEWFLSVQEIRDMLTAKAPHLNVEAMSNGEVWIWLGRDDIVRPPCPSCGATCLVVLNPDDAEERPKTPEMTHRCAACGEQCHWEEPPCA